MAVHFKFRSAVDFDKVEFEGPAISVYDLKRRIVDHKKLSNFNDFDLVISDPVSGKEFNDGAALVPRGTSVIIKRVPALVSSLDVAMIDFDSEKNILSASSLYKGSKQEISLPLVEDNDDFGDLDVDLSSNSGIETSVDGRDNLSEKRDIDHPCYADAHDEDAVLCKASSPGISDTDSFNNGNKGSILEKNSLPGDVEVDSKLHNSMLNKSSLFEAPTKPNIKYLQRVEDVWHSKKFNSNLPFELKCSICQGIFQSAVMIPCCQFSFCHGCIKTALFETGKCPQCNSSKFKVEDLLPNIALRQAIDHFLESEVTNIKVEHYTTKNAPDGESAVHAKEVSSHPMVQKQGLSEFKRSIIDNGEAESISKPEFSSCHKDDNTTMESQVGRGKKRKNPLHVKGSKNLGSSAKSRKGDHRCYNCGLPGHIARECLQRSAGYAQTSFLNAGNVAPYCPDAFIPGVSVPHFMPFANMYGSSFSTPFETPALPYASYAFPSYVPALYSGVPIQQSDFMRMGSGTTFVAPERPLSKEEFMEFQRQQMLIQEQQRYHSPKFGSRSYGAESQEHWQDQYELSDNKAYYRNDVKFNSIENDKRIRRKEIGCSTDYRDMISTGIERRPQFKYPEDVNEQSRNEKHKLKQDRRKCCNPVSAEDDSIYSTDNKLKKPHSSRKSVRNDIEKHISKLENGNQYHAKACSSISRSSECTKHNKDSSKKISSKNNYSMESGSETESNASHGRSRKYTSKAVRRNKERDTYSDTDDRYCSIYFEKVNGDREFDKKKSRGNYRKRQGQSINDNEHKYMDFERKRILKSDEKYGDMKSKNTEGTRYQSRNYIRNLTSYLPENLSNLESDDNGRWHMSPGLEL